MLKPGDRPLPIQIPCIRREKIFAGVSRIGPICYCLLWARDYYAFPAKKISRCTA